MHPIFTTVGGPATSPNPQERVMVSELFTRALASTDFLSEITPDQVDLMGAASDAVDQAISDYEYDRGIAAGTLVVSASVIDTVRRMLVAYANDALLDAADAANDLFRDAREARDVDANGNVVHETYRSIGQ